MDDVSLVVIGDVVRIRRPAAEHGAVRDSTHARIVEDLDKLGRRVGVLDVHGGDRLCAVGRGVIEVYGDARHHGLDDHVHGEVARRESDAVGLGNNGLGLGQRTVVVIVDGQRLAVAEGGVGDGDVDGLVLGRLPGVAVLIFDGDVVAGQLGLVGGRLGRVGRVGALRA